VLHSFGVIHVPGPAARDDPFWNGRDKEFGVWHIANASASHQTPCFEARYRTDSIGTRDRERSAESTEPRVLVLGDSYFEGWGVPVEDRVTDRLEAATRIEHVNLAMSHFGPYQELLAYRVFAPRFAHTAVMIGILPMNDFYDLDYDVALRSPGYYYRYRPYLVGDYPDYHRVDYRESDMARFLRRNCYACDELTRLYYELAGDGAGFDTPADFRDVAGNVNSEFYNYTPKQYKLLRYCLERLVDESGGRTVVVVLLPGPLDFLRYYQSGPSPLARSLKQLADTRHFVLVDLLPPMFTRTTDWGGYFFDCDPHWNEHGHEVASEILLSELRGVLY
jgi:hypothetical protein